MVMTTYPLRKMKTSQESTKKIKMMLHHWLGPQRMVMLMYTLVYLRQRKYQRNI